TAYPISDEIEIRIDPESPVEFDLRLRIPGWSEGPVEIAVNGRPARLRAEPGTFAAIARRWRKGDTVNLRFPFPFRALPIEQRAKDTVAVLHGPLMLVAIDPPDPLAAPASALARMKAVPGKPGEFECDAIGGAVRMRPFFQVQGETYTT